MFCPKCELGEINKIQFKSSEKIAYLCDMCETLWLENESITSMSGHTLSSFANSLDREYVINDADADNTIQKS